MKNFWCSVGLHRFTFKKLFKEGFWDFVGQRKVEFYQCDCFRQWMHAGFMSCEYIKEPIVKHKVPEDIDKVLENI
jgi:hypothetical protein